jgi:competence protein ComFB
MKDKNWQNPYNLIANTGGTFTFWPKPVATDKSETQETFEYAIRITAEAFAELNHSFAIPVISEQVSSSFSLSRTFKLPDLYLFPPGEEAAQRIVSD